jgi:hypothetical protein
MGRVLVQQPGTNTAKALTETLPKNVIIVDEDLHQLRLHDGVTPGGHVIGGGGGIGNIDDITITENANQEIQAVAVIDQNTGIVKTWTGTMAEYEAIVTKDPETEYIITDDVGGSATEIGQITEALNDKVDKGHQVVEFQEPTATNNYTWYRKYADGWVEQGGISAWKVTITLPIVMSDTNYCVQISGNMTDASTLGYPVDAINKTINGFYLGTRDTGSQQVAWQVSGMAA